MTPPRGWELFDHNSTGYLEVQKDDEAGVFDTDDDAWMNFINGLDLGDRGCIEVAVELLENWHEPMAAVMRGEMPTEY